MLTKVGIESDNPIRFFPYCSVYKSLIELLEKPQRELMEGLADHIQEQDKNVVNEIHSGSHWTKEMILTFYFKCPSKLQYLLAKFFLNAVINKNEITEIVRH